MNRESQRRANGTGSGKSYAGHPEPTQIPPKKQCASTLPHNALEQFRAQFVMVAHGVRPEWAAMLAAHAFGGGAQ
jgi:hypothetical protein